MRVNFFVIAFTFLFSSISLASFSCHLTQHLGNPKVANDASFWEQFGKISGKGGDKELSELFKKYDIDARSGNNNVAVERRAPSTPTRQAYSLDKTATAELRDLPNGLRNKAEEFLQVAKGGSQDAMLKLRNNPGRWRLEKAREYDGYSVRLNEGYRVVFKEGPDKTIQILRFSNTATHSGH